jgi:preprotein translocase subunit SecB
MPMNMPLPTTGYSIVRIYAVRQAQELVDTTSLPADAETRDVSFAWDWRITERQFEVLLGVTIGPSRTCGERLVYHAVGTFDVADENPTVPLEDFVSQNAIATLLPFIREGLAHLSGRGPFDTYYLPPINAMKLATGFDYQASTGRKQLELFPEFRTNPFPPSSAGDRAKLQGA